MIASITARHGLSEPYCFLYASHIVLPAILAAAYGQVGLLERSRQQCPATPNNTSVSSTILATALGCMAA